MTLHRSALANCPCIQLLQMVKKLPPCRLLKKKIVRGPIYFPKPQYYSDYPPVSPGARKLHKRAAAGASARKRSSDNTKKQKAKTSTASTASAAADQNLHAGVTCDHCFDQNIAGGRHRCSECVDFDLCDACFAEHQHAHIHPASSFMRFSSPVVHTNVRCRGCQLQPLAGTRYECTSCKPSLNMCHTCWSTPAKHASQPRHTARHRFVRFAVQGGQGVGCNAHDAVFTAAVDELKRKAQARK